MDCQLDVGSYFVLYRPEKCKHILDLPQRRKKPRPVQHSAVQYSKYTR